MIRKLRSINTGKCTSVFIKKSLIIVVLIYLLLDSHGLRTPLSLCNFSNFPLLLLASRFEIAIKTEMTTSLLSAIYAYIRLV